MKIYSYYGYRDFIIALGYKAEVIKEYFLNYNMYNNDFTIDLETNEISMHSGHEERDWKVALMDTGLNSLKGARVKRAEKYLDDVNMLTYGDGVADVNIHELVAFHRSHNKLLTITGVHPPARFGEIIESKGLLVSFQEKPQTSIGLINGGFMVFNRGLLDYLTEDEGCDLEYGVFEKLAEKHEIMLYKHDKQWGCLDTERDLKHLNDLWNQNRAFWRVW
jgi:glucose-1-phosphate cytidylyltransferase